MLKTRFLQKPRKNVRPLIFTIAICVLSSLIYASVSVRLLSTTIGSGGTVKILGVGVYWDETSNNPVSFIDWGIIDPGSQQNVTVYVRNEGNVPMSVSLGTDNWDPADASSHITLSWDYSGQILEPDEITKVTLTLSISSSVQNVTNFHFDIMIAEAH